MKGITELLRKSNNRRFSLTVKFDHSSEGFEIHLTGTSDPTAITEALKMIQQASSVYGHAKSHNVRLDSISIQLDGTNEMLVIGNVDGKPRLVINLDKNDFKEIKLSASDSSQDAAPELWILGINMERLNYLEALKERGHETSADQIAQLREEIKQGKQPFLW